MHSVRCTSCERSLTVPKPVIQGKIRCPACGAVFVGTTHPVGAAARAESAAPAGPRRVAPAVPERPMAPDGPEAGPPPAAGAPTAAGAPAATRAAEDALLSLGAAAAAAAEAAHTASAHAPHAPVPAPAPAAVRAAPRVAARAGLPRRGNKALYLYLLMGGFLVFLIVFVIMVAHYAGKVYYEERDEKGRVTFRGRVTKEEAERRKKALSEAGVVDYEERDATGRVTFRGRLTKEEAERRKKAAMEGPPRPATPRTDDPVNPHVELPPMKGRPGPDANAPAPPPADRGAEAT